VIDSHNSWSGFLYTWNDALAMEVTEAEREAFFEQQWNKGGFNFYIGNFKDVVFTKDANETAYQFWRKKTVERINDPVKQEKLAPLVAPNPFGTKRPSLERTYYEVYNQENVDLIDLLENPIDEIIEKGVRLKDGTVIELDVLVFATGFDSVSGGLTNIPISNKDGLTLKKKWANGIFSYLGMGTTGFPNLFWVYGPQAPTGFANGPTCIETQGEWIVKCLRYLRREGFTRIEADATAETEWREHVLQMGTIGLFHEAKSWYFGANIPGKPVEALNYMAGMPAYRQRINASADNDYEGFHLS
jgi:cation diffusion facilitator CzcD-associated flavoprotein CzcO